MEKMQKFAAKRRLALCLSTTKSEYQAMIHSEIPCKVIYSRDYFQGTLYALSLQKSKTHATLDRAMLRLDDILKQGRDDTHFVSLSNIMSGKVKTFAVGEHAWDEHFRCIFVSDFPGGGRTLHTQLGVNVWKPDRLDTDTEFDVVKKRRAMNAASDEESCPLALRAFEEFEANVLDAISVVSSVYQKSRFDEFLEMEKDCMQRTLPVSGCVYVAISRAVKYPKIGATRRSDPLCRLKELSRHVPSPFNLVYSVSTICPFSLEAEIHKEFDAFRIREKGACTEFFSVDLEIIEEFLKRNYDDFKKH